MESPSTRCTSLAAGFSGPETGHSLQHPDAQTAAAGLFRQDLVALLDLLQQRKIKRSSRSAFLLPRQDARRSCFGKGGVVGKIVLVRNGP